MQQKQTSAAIIGSALRKRGGTQEVLRLIEPLADKEALELLQQGSTEAKRPLLPLFVLCLIALLLVIGLDFYRASFSPHWSMDAKIGLVLLHGVPPIIFLILLNQRSDKILAAAVRHRAERITDTNALPILLDFTLIWYPASANSQIEAGRACWQAVYKLLPRLSEAEAAGISPIARSFLHRFVQGGQPDLPSLNDHEKLPVLLILAAVKDDKTRKLIEKQAANPALRDAMQSILDKW